MPELRPEPPREACAEWQGDIASWAVAQGAPEREAALVAHLAGCARCREEADALLAVAAVALAADPDAPSAPAVEPDIELDLEVELELDRSFEAMPDPPVDLADRISARIRRERRSHLVRRSLVAAAGAAAAAAVLVTALSLSSGNDVAPVRGTHFAFAVEPRGADAHAVVGHDDVKGSVVQLTATGLDPTITYALWLTPPGGGYADRVPAGTFRPDGHGKVDVRLHCSLPVDQVGRVWATTPDRQLALDTA
jgi:hypothetical protein